MKDFDLNALWELREVIYHRMLSACKGASEDEGATGLSTRIDRILFLQAIWKDIHYTYEKKAKELQDANLPEELRK